jgi:uncharacterized protein YbjQ (UPF0145 family)|tara:strand:- start:2737 stop:3804 length:1068 start_codon:yes stop_codon:yes gene_type:complete
MNNYMDVLITTSSTLDGAKIKQYFGIVSAHVVAGTNVFSDIAAGLSDFFGGRTATYADQISRIKAQALTDLKYEAIELGANAVISVTIDVDEVSGGGKSMFMITAYGTAVTLDKVHIENLEDTKTDLVTGNVLADAIEKRILVEQHKSAPLEMTNDEWCRLLELKVPEMGDFIEWEMVNSGLKEERLFAYVASIDFDDSIALGYKLFEKASKEGELRTIQKVINKIVLVDYHRSISLLKSKSNSLAHKKAMLNTIIKPKRLYSRDDINILNELIDTVEASFPTIAIFKKKKGLLGKEKELWECICNQKENDADDSFCKSCGRDKRGFKTEETTPEKAIKYLSMIKETLNEALPSQ